MSVIRDVNGSFILFNTLDDDEWHPHGSHFAILDRSDAAKDLASNRMGYLLPRLIYQVSFYPSNKSLPTRKLSSLKQTRNVRRKFNKSGPNGIRKVWKRHTMRGINVCNCSKVSYSVRFLVLQIWIRPLHFPQEKCHTSFPTTLVQWREWSKHGRIDQFKRAVFVVLTQ